MERVGLVLVEVARFAVARGVWLGVSPCSSAGVVAAEAVVGGVAGCCHGVPWRASEAA